MPPVAQRSLAMFARFARARRGATAVEFAIVALPFLILLFAILELGLVFMVNTTLEDATDRAARKIRTGEFQTATANTKQDFVNEVCGRMSWLSSSCNGNLFVDVQTFASFTAASQAQVVNGSNFNPDTTCFFPGAPSDIVLVRVFYQWKLYTPLLNNALANYGSKKRLISTVAAFRNEPYNNTTGGATRCT